MKNEKRSTSTERIIIGGETEVPTPVSNGRISSELLQKFEGKSREVTRINFTVLHVP